MVTQPMPWTNPPITWPRSMAGLSDRPRSIRISTRVTVSSPVNRSIIHLGNGGAVGEIEKRIAAAGLAIEIDPGRGIEAARTEVDALLIGQPDKLGEIRAGSPGLRMSTHAPQLEANVRRRGARCHPRRDAKWRAADSGEPALQDFAGA